MVCCSPLQGSTFHYFFKEQATEWAMQEINYDVVGLSYKDMLMDNGVAEWQDKLATRLSSMLPAVSTNLQYCSNLLFNSSIVAPYKIVVRGHLRIAALVLTRVGHNAALIHLNSADKMIAVPTNTDELCKFNTS